MCEYSTSPHWRLTVNCCLLIRFEAKPNLRNFPIAKSKVTHGEQKRKGKITFTFEKIILENMFSLLLLPFCCAWPRDTMLKMKDKRQQLANKLAYDQGNPSSNPNPDPSQSQCWRFCFNIVAQFQLFYCYFNVAKAPKKLPLRAFQILHN